MNDVFFTDCAAVPAEPFIAVCAALLPLRDRWPSASVTEEHIAHWPLQSFPQQELVPCPRSSVARVRNSSYLCDGEKIVEAKQRRVKAGILGEDGLDEIMLVEKRCLEERPSVRVSL